MKVVYEIPDFLEDKFANMDEKDICAYITKALSKDNTMTDRLCLDMRLDQNDNFAKIFNKLAEIENNIKSGVVVTAGSQPVSSSSISFSQEVQEEERYVALEVGDNEDEDDGFNSFIM